MDRPVGDETEAVSDNEAPEAVATGPTPEELRQQRANESMRFLLAVILFLALLGCVAVLDRVFGGGGRAVPVPYPITPAAPASVIVLPAAREQCADASGAVRAFVEFAYAPFSGYMGRGVAVAGAFAPFASDMVPPDQQSPPPQRRPADCNDTHWSIMPRGLYATQQCHERTISVGECSPAGLATCAGPSANGTRVYVLERTSHLPRLPWIRYMYDASRYALRARRAAMRRSAAAAATAAGDDDDLDEDVWLTDELFTSLASAADSCAEVRSIEYLVRAPALSGGRLVAHGLYTHPPRPRDGAEPPAAPVASSAALVTSRVRAVLNDGVPLACETMHTWGGPVTHYRATSGSCRVRFEDGGLFIAHTRPASPVVTVPV